MKKFSCVVLTLLLLLGLMVPDVSADTVIDISTAAQLSAIRNDLDGRYRLVKDIDLSGSQWEPIGTGYTASTAFTGVLDGNGHTIKGLTIVHNGTGSDAKFAGLFGHMNGTVKDLTLKGVDITVKETKSARVGAVAGQSQGVIEGVTASGRVQCLSTSNTAAVGGIVGRQTKVALISGCSSAVDVKVTGNTIRLGGILGENEGGKVLLSQTVGKVDGNATYQLYIGGIAGHSHSASSGNVVIEAEITDCLRDGATVGFAKSRLVGGGLIGWNESGVLKNAISLQTVDFTGDTNVTAGQIIGENGGDAENTYYVKNDAGLTEIGTGTVISAVKLSKNFTENDVRDLLANNASWAFKDGSLQLKGLDEETSNSTTKPTSGTATTKKPTSSSSSATTTLDDKTSGASGSITTQHLTMVVTDGSTTTTTVTTAVTTINPERPVIGPMPALTTRATTSTSKQTVSSSADGDAQNGSATGDSTASGTQSNDGSVSTTTPQDAPVQGGLSGDEGQFGDDDTTDEERAEQTGGIPPMVWIVLGAVIVVAGVAIAIVLVLKKRKKSTEEES